MQRLAPSQLRRGTGLALALALAFATLGSAAFAEGAPKPPALPHFHQMHAMYVIDHSGRNPVDPTELIAYSLPFQKILGSCKTNVTDLTNRMIYLASKAAELGARKVTSLDMLKATARRITWGTPKRGCGYIYNIAEGNLENGVG